MAFRPFYMLAAWFGAAAILAWGLGYGGTVELPGLFWHAHEMIWGYAGAVMVGFLLTAVATWTGQPPCRGACLCGLVVLWLAARISLYLPQGLWLGALFSGLFYLAASAAVAWPIWRSRNQRNYIVPVAWLLFGLTQLGFHQATRPLAPQALMAGLMAGLVMVAGFIGLIGMRVIPFFTARALGSPQVNSPAWLPLGVLLMPMLISILVLGQWLPEGVAVLAVLTMLIQLIQLWRWRQVQVWHQPLLWILFAGYAASALGLGLFGMAWAWQPAWLSAGVHLIAVGGIGLLTLGMMARTALGHTGRPMRLSAPMPLAFGLMLLATLTRTLASFLLSGSLYEWLIPLSAALFAAALLLFAYRYVPWLWQARADGKPG